MFLLRLQGILEPYAAISSFKARRMEKALLGGWSQLRTSEMLMEAAAKGREIGNKILLRS